MWDPRRTRKAWEGSRQQGINEGCLGAHNFLAWNVFDPIFPIVSLPLI